MRRSWDFKEQELKDVAWAFSKAGVRHPALFKHVARHLVGGGEGEEDDVDDVRGLESFTPQGVGNLAWSYARQAQLADSATGMLKSMGVVGGVSSGRLAVYETCCLDLGEDLVHLLFAGLAEAALGKEGEDKIKTFKPQDLSNTAWAFATLGLLHRRFYHAVSEEVTQRLKVHISHRGKLIPSSSTTNTPKQKFKAQEIANLLWSYATLNYRAPQMFDIAADYIVHICSETTTSATSPSYTERSIAKVFNRQELANVAWACAVLERYPEELMLLLYTGLLGRDYDAVDERTGQRMWDTLRSVYGDDGLQKQAVMSLLYVQMAMDIEAPHIGLSLPRGFPSNWIEKNALMDSGNTSNSNMLELTSSRLQETVSRAFRRIGYDHVQEHILGTPFTDGIENNDYQTIIESASKFISIDIANVDNRVGIEVDGPAHFVNVLDNAPPTSTTRRSTSSNDDMSGVEQHLIFNNNNARRGRGGGAGKKKKMELRYGKQIQENGPTALKHRLLCHLGWTIIHMPFWEWSDVDGDEESENEYCKILLKEVLG